MTTQEIAVTLVELCRAGKLDEAYPTLFADNAVHIEGTGEVTTGLSAILANAEAFDAETAVSDVTVQGPFVHGDQFALHYAMTMTTKATGASMPFAEVALYEVSNGKIVSEKFLYGVG
ncbi:MAG: nuclear transport factor 2 family protein [Armatimonadetes bacterium]|nr:nuclear transport factor 2 family protein [Armatimonadota bacterium]